MWELYQRRHDSSRNCWATASIPLVDWELSYYAAVCRAEGDDTGIRMGAELDLAVLAAESIVHAVDVGHVRRWAGDGRGGIQ